MTSVKGLLKGLRYITQIFEPEKEPEMQIGLPTDVKHVAHIGWDGPSSNDPTWMSGFKSVPEIANQPSNPLKESKNPGKHLESVSAAAQDTKPRGTTSTDKPKHKSRRKSSTGGDSILDSPIKHHSDGSKQSRRSMDSPGGEVNESNNPGDDPAAAGVPKSTRRRKSKAGEGTSKASKSKGQNSLPDISLELCDKTETGHHQGMKNNEIKQSSIVETNEEERDEISAGI